MPLKQNTRKTIEAITQDEARRFKIPAEKRFTAIERHTQKRVRQLLLHQ
jgi:hypothetical protein